MRILAAGYASMQRYARYLATRLRDGLLDFGLGDWYDVGPKPPGEAQWTSRILTGTAIYCEILLVLARIAGILGHGADASRYADGASSATQAFNARLFDPHANRYDRGSMTANAMPLAIGLVPAVRRAAVLANLGESVRDRVRKLPLRDPRHQPAFGLARTPTNRSSPVLSSRIAYRNG